MTVRDPHTYRWVRRNIYGPIRHILGVGWAEHNLPLPGHAYAVGAPNAHRNDAEIDYGRSKYRRAHGGKHEQARRHARLLIQMAGA